MENPATWGPAEKILSGVLDEHLGLPQDLCGLSLERRLADALRKEGLLRAELPARAPWDPVPHLAALIDGLQAVVSAGTDEGVWALLVPLLTGPYAALRGGLLLDEPGRDHLSTEEALREVLAPDPRMPRAAELDAQLSELLDPPWPEGRP